MRDVRTMVGEVVAQKAMSEETIATVVERTGGVPLFVEELTRAVLESDNAKLTGREIPVTLHDSLMARLDRLGPAKEVLQVGAVIGSEFSYELLHAVHPFAEEDLQGALRKLADAELIYPRGIPPEASYTFKHALIHDAAYEALLRSRRKDLHRRVAHTIDEKFAALKEMHPEVLARHWTEAGETESAIAQWVRAGNTAEARNAFSEALKNYQQAVALLNLLPRSAERDHRELELSQLALQMLFVTKGYSARETTDAIECAAALAEKTGKLTHLVGAALNRILAPLNSGDLSVAGILADQALELALREGSPGAIGMAHAFQTCTRWQRGDLSGVEQHYTKWIRFVDDPLFRQVPGAAIWTFGAASYAAWVAGRSDAARQRMAQMTEFANKDNPHDLVLSALCSADLMLLMRKYDDAEILSARALEVAEKHQFSNELVYSQCSLGQARVPLRPDADTMALLRQGIAGAIENGTRLGVSWATAALAKALERVGAIDDALETVEQALQTNTEQRVNRPHILTIRGKLRLEAEQPELAEADFREAIALAQKMGAKGWELRATMSLTRLLAKQGQRDEARTMLADIYGWFTEGFDTADLKDARALLDELNG
jgi:tetratricopeptide (TPR) repeat protein